MKRLIGLFLCAVLLATVLSGMTFSATAEDAPENVQAFRLSGISDVTGGDGTRTYSVYAPYTDTYTLSSPDTVSISLSRNGSVLAEGSDSLAAELTEGEVYTLSVQTEQANASFVLAAQAENHLVTLPYDVGEPADVSSISTEGDGADPLVPAEVQYQKRGGGTYIYSNNPEAIPADAVGKAFIRSEGLTGEVYFTFEHANYSGSPIYLGYQLKNDGDSDVYITVTNVGYQAGGTWFGQRAWYDFYNISFAPPDDYFSNPSKYFQDYAFQNYTPRVFQPITYRLPAGEYFYVIGGTSEDAYQHINVDGSANKTLGDIRCANGNVKFTVTGGSVTGTFYAYNDSSQVQSEPASLGYVTGDYASQYSGKADHAGVIDNYMMWTFSDETQGGALPVTYTNYYDDRVSAQTAPYTAYNSTPHTVNATSWMTHLNPQNSHDAVGMDMVEFLYYDQNGNEVLVDNDHADGAGKPANTGNWMIEYQDHFTLVNQGDAEREVKLTIKDNGALAMLVRDSVTGEILRADLTAGLNQPSPNYTYAVTVPAHSIKQITLDYVLLACSYGSVVHAATLSRYTPPREPVESTVGEENSKETVSEPSDGPDATASDEAVEDAGTLKWVLVIAIPVLAVLIGGVTAVVLWKKHKQK